MYRRVVFISAQYVNVRGIYMRALFISARYLCALGMGLRLGQLVDLRLTQLTPHLQCTVVFMGAQCLSTHGVHRRAVFIGARYS